LQKFSKVDMFIYYRPRPIRISIGLDSHEQSMPILGRGMRYK